MPAQERVGIDYISMRSSDFPQLPSWVIEGYIYEAGQAHLYEGAIPICWLR